MTGVEVLVIGEALVDVVHRADGRVDETPGGSPANVALALGRLGVSPLLLTTLAKDAHGDSVRRWLEDSGVEVLASPSARTATATARLDESGSAHYEFDIEWKLPHGRALPLSVRPSIVHTGSIATFLLPGADDVQALLIGLRETALITYDPNIRPALLADHDGARRRAETFVAQADVVKASDEDLLWLYPGVDPLQSAQNWLALGPAVVVVTMGAAGAAAVAASGVTRVGGERVEVVDTVGAGDTFMSALIDGLIELGQAGADARSSIQRIEPETLQMLLARGVRAAAVTVSRPGADPPGRGELLPLRA